MRPRFIPIVLLAFVSIVSAQSAPAATDSANETSIPSLLEHIQRLEKRVSELEDNQRKQAAAQANMTPPAAPEQPAMAEPPKPEYPTSAPEVREAEIHYPSLQIRGFGDVDFSATDEKGRTSGFDLGPFDLHFASPLSQKVSYFGEVSFTARPNTYDLQVERTIIRYDYNDHAKISFGKYHTPISYWNTAFHHGAWLQTTIDRPEMVRIGTPFIPIHFVGLLAEGNVPSGGLGLGYSVGLGNGRSTILSRAGDSGDANNNRAWVASVFARPARFYGLQFGGAVYRDKLSPEHGPNLSEWITSGHVVWAKERPEFISEFANVHHHEINSNHTFNSQAFYVQLAYRLPWLENKWKPYYRFEYIHRPQSEPSPDISDLVGSTLGMRYDITNYAAFKAEYRNSRRGINEPRINGVFLQTAFTF